MRLIFSRLRAWAWRTMIFAIFCPAIKLFYA
jgi:hypothetical protein